MVGRLATGLGGAPEEVDDDGQLVAGVTAENVVEGGAHPAVQADIPRPGAGAHGDDDRPAIGFDAADQVVEAREVEPQFAQPELRVVDRASPASGVASLRARLPRPCPILSPFSVVSMRASTP